MTRRIENRVGEDGRRVQMFAPSATGLAQPVTVPAAVTAICRHCSQQLAWLFEIPGKGETWLIKQTYDHEFFHRERAGRVDAAADERTPIIFPGIVAREFPSYCGQCRVQRMIGRAELVHAIETGTRTVRSRRRQ